jgi:hypothetical protein
MPENNAAECILTVRLLPTNERDPSRVFQLRLFERLYESVTLFHCEVLAVLFLLNELTELLGIHLLAILRVSEAECTVTRNSGMSITLK